MAKTRFDAVFFDCDSTLSRIEGIDQLAVRAGIAEQVIALTNAAMEGWQPVETIYQKRLDLIRPDQSAIEWLGQQYLQQVVEDADHVVQVLLDHQIEVHIISGGLRAAIIPLADRLGLPLEHLHAVEVYWDQEGRYLGFDQDSPLIRSQGKVTICREILAANKNLQQVAMVGDGVTDLAAAKAGAHVIAFAGVVRREGMLKEAVDIIDGPGLIRLLDLVQLG